MMVGMAMFEINLIGRRVDPEMQWIQQQSKELNLMAKLRKYFPGSVIYTSMDLSREVVEKLKPLMQPVDLGIILGSSAQRVLLLGEDHGQQRAKRFAVDLLEPLRDQGFTHIGIEWLGSEYASFLNCLCRSSSGWGKLRDLLLDYRRVGFMAQSGEENLSFLDTAYRLGFTVIPINITHSMDKVDSRLFTSEQDITYRDIWMAKMINLGLREPSLLARGRESRMAVMVGAGHLDQNLSLPNVLRGEYGIESSSIFYATEGAAVERPMMIPLNEETIKQIPMYSPINGYHVHGKYPYPANWIIFIP